MPGLHALLVRPDPMTGSVLFCQLTLLQGCPLIMRRFHWTIVHEEYSSLMSKPIGLLEPGSSIILTGTV